MIADCEVCVMCIKMMFFHHGGTSDLIMRVAYNPRYRVVVQSEGYAITQSDTH